MPRRLLIIAHAPSPNTLRLREAAAAGACHQDIEGVETEVLAPFDVNPDHVCAADALLLGTTENLGYMSGALKDFFDRIYYPCLEETRGRPFGFYIRAGHDGTGTRRAIETITTGLGWRAVTEPVLCRGVWQDMFADRCEELGMTLAAGLEAGVF
ncbi:MAG: flavodoxin family protein [Alphaproteobacteria bacterium]|nr:flavodoxin family protein [Alphaproteobacteria bacterium]MCY4231158.1 flavodoxin family protein [Alphaproteobacteria bacterium]MCY4317639.1 flavodoxin family protein [Alphaproteobacteria bacterium]